ncbi:uncharacterized protein TrAFT101_007567 [Trichoderma asperellum]|uniref:uncharacterized protein n=1 Tax=Trichoderma asperellum TaxID=101201 RepID=UPI00331CC1E1|nr:hypothetical protein TrAFT101_007567 [Trichoderma asperellum]
MARVDHPRVPTPSVYCTWTTTYGIGDDASVRAALLVLGDHDDFLKTAHTRPSKRSGKWDN